MKAHLNTYKLPIHLIRQYIFCPRIVYFLEILKVPKSTPLWVKEGESHHERQTNLFKRRTLVRFKLENAIFKTNQTLYAEEYNFQGICDCLIINEDKVYPVEIKLHGTKVFHSQKLQLIAYGILCESIFKKKCEIGFILFEKDAKTIPITITRKDKEEVIKLVDDIIQMIEIEKFPNSNADGAKCTQCEFENYCNDRF